MASQSRPVSERFEEVFKAHFARIYTYIYYRIGNFSTAEDLTADVFVRAYEHLDSYSPSKGSLNAWLGTIARNAVYNHIRNSSRRPQSVSLVEGVCSITNIEEDFLQKEAVRELFAKIKKLPEAHQELLEMKYFLCFTNRDIAKLTGMSESNVGSTLHRIVKGLEKKLPK